MTTNMSTRPSQDVSDLPEADQLAILHTLSMLQQGFATRDADMLTTVYSDDADWVNAFGTVQHGGPAIVTYLRGLFADANFDAGTVSAGPDIQMRVLTPEVVAVSVHVVVDGQGLIGGGTLHRDNHSLHILQRRADGTWPIVTEMYNDANTVQTYAKQT